MKNETIKMENVNWKSLDDILDDYALYYDFSDGGTEYDWLIANIPKKYYSAIRKYFTEGLLEDDEDDKAEIERINRMTDEELDKEISENNEGFWYEVVPDLFPDYLPDLYYHVEANEFEDDDKEDMINGDTYISIDVTKILSDYEDSTEEGAIDILRYSETYVDKDKIYKMICDELNEEE